MAEISHADTLRATLNALTKAVEEKPESFASGSGEILAPALEAAKCVFDLSVQTETISAPHIVELLSTLAHSQAPQTRSQTKSHKRTPSPPPTIKFPETPLSSLYVEGMDDDKIWAQLDLRMKNVCELLDLALEGDPEGNDEGSESSEMDERLRKALEAMENGEDPDLEGLYDEDDEDDDDDDSVMGDFDEDMDEDGVDEDEEEDEDEDGEGEGEEGIMELRDESEDEDGETPFSFPETSRRPPRRKGSKMSGSELDDGFFDLDAFNAETEQAEAKSSSKGHLGEEDESDDDMSVDLFTSVDQREAFDEDDLEEPGELYYRDFFEPPPRVQKPTPKKLQSNSKTGGQKSTGKVRFHEEVRVKKIRAKGKNLPLNAPDDDEDEEDDYNDMELSMEDAEFEDEEMDDEELEEDEGSSDSEDGEKPTTSRETIERLKDDLFAEEGEVPSNGDLSTHEKRMAALREQISELESENVAPKEWVLMGEASSKGRPQNSLLEEDLEFERVMKAVPVITEETVQVLEERIKARILENRFDDVVRIRPLEDKPFLPSRFFELQDAKSSQSLAQIYENEYVGAQTGGSVDDRDGKLKKEHDEIEQLWEQICGKLDALCNAHFVPKMPKAVISTISNTATATLESAIPTSKSTSTMLAPEEIFAPSSSEVRDRSELTPTEKRALRTKERKVKKKQRERLETSVDKYGKARGIGGVKKQKQAALESVVKHGKGVTVVGKEKVKGGKGGKGSRRGQQ